MSRFQNQLRKLQASHSYGFVMLFVVATVILSIAIPEGSPWKVAIVVCQVTTALLACWTSEAPKRLFRLVIVFSAFSLLATVGISIIGGIESPESRSINVLATLIVMAVIMRGIALDIRAQGVRGRAVAGALTVYLLFGTLLGFVYGLEVSLGSSDVLAGVGLQGASESTGPDNMYFSFVTLTTVGYGDLAPVSGAARGTAIFEALVGQLYLVGVVATLGGALGRGRGAIEEDLDGADAVSGSSSNSGG
ncbi:MAG: hypothetical protein F2813_03585 [Actinobacteria bacterium]|uniref:Unannotated protein n=1 Tax=freshwater metagenome TaxID=449393 RepID=A0A6J5ZJC5_9ZZZZ|nr:hypothetical protein [Actinomycetota bacterium]